MRFARATGFIPLCFLSIIILSALAAAAFGATTQGNINTLVAAGKSGSVLQGMAMERCNGIMTWNRPYMGDAVKDCYGYSRQVWNAILFDGSTHPEDYNLSYYSYTVANKWLAVSGGIPVNTYPDSNWDQISNLGGVSNLLPGDLCGTVQGHEWGMSVHYGIYAGKDGSGNNMCYQCGGGYDGAYYTPFYSGWKWYYKPLHAALALEPGPPPGTFIVDNGSATFTGTWTTGTTSTDKYGSDYRYVNVQTPANATATWRPNLDKPGYYDVFVWYSQGSNRSAVAPYTIVCKDGSTTFPTSQKSGGGVWNKIASAKPFYAGTSGYVTLSNGTGESSGVVIADAVKFVFVADLDVVPPVINSVTCVPAVAAAGHPVRVNVSASDNVGVTGVTANGVALVQGAGNTWTGTLTANAALGTYPVTVVASDATQNTSTDSTASYRVAPVIAASVTTLLKDKAILPTAGNYLFKTWGIVDAITTDTFVVIDSSRAVYVSCPNHGLTPRCRATVCGTWDPTKSTISCQNDQVELITP